MSDASEPAVIVAAGRPIGEATSWVGHACWAELRLFEVLTSWLAAEADGARTLELWSVRSDAASRAAAWHDRLPVLREVPRASLVVPSSPAIAQVFVDLDALAGGEPPSRRGALAAVLQGLRRGYHAHQQVAVGPADAPVATTLRDALRSTFEVAGDESDPRWVDAIAGAGGLP